MKNYKLQIVEGFKDIFGKEMLLRKEIEKIALDVFRHHGYEHIKTPQVEYIDVYSTKGVQKPDLYNLINRQGEVLALCNDMTSSIARFVCSREFSKETKKYCYLADTFRYPRQYQGKKHEFLQAGIELIGKKSIYKDIECIYISTKVLKSCNVNSYTVHLGSSDFIHALLNDFKIDEANQKRIHEAIENKNYVLLREILLECDNQEHSKFIIDLMMKGGHLRYLETLMDYLKGMSSYDVLVYLKGVYQGLKDMGIENIIFDFSIYSYAEYYTGIVYEIYVNGLSKSIVSGGRSDKLFAYFGKDYDDVGFGLDVDTLTEYVLKNNLIDISCVKYLAISDSKSFTYTLKNNEELISNGIIVNNIDNMNLDEALEYAKNNNYSAVLEYKNNSVKKWEVM